MINVLRPEFQQSLLRLGRLGTEFWFRTLRLSLTGAEGNGQRLYRLQNQCGGRVLDGFLQLGNWRTDAAVGSNGVEVISACHDAYVEEARNSEQVALLTFEEMMVWFDSFCKEWRKLAKSTLN